MWPGRPPARRSTSSAAANMRSGGPEERRRIEVALDGAVTDRAPMLVERQPPVEADDVPAGLGEVGEDRGRPMPKWMSGTPGRPAVEDRARVRQRELAVVAAAERADPRVEDLDGLRAGFDLRAQIVADGVATVAQSRCQASGCAYINALVRAKCSRDRLRSRRRRA